MRWRWILFDYVDPQLGLSKAERATVRQQIRSSGAATDIGRKCRLRLMIVAILPGAFMLITVGPVFIFDVPWTLVPWLIAGQIVATLFTMSVVGRWAYKPLVVEALRDLGYDVCHRCGYDLRGSPESKVRCPECGAEPSRGESS